MKRFFNIFLFLYAIAAAILCMCKEKPVAQKTQITGKKDTTHTLPSAGLPFTPPPDSSISPEKMRSWIRCNGLLDSLTLRYADSFKTQDPAVLMRYQKDFINAQNKICIRVGLTGGYEEYKWILQNIGIEKNRRLLDSVNASTF